MRISARTQYALRAMVALAAAGGPLNAERIAAEQDIPRRFCDNILLHLRRAGLIHSQRGPDGGYWLAQPPEKISLADVIRVTEGIEPAATHFPGAAAPLAEIWARLHDHEHTLLSEITLADILSDEVSSAGGEISSAGGEN
ncbi:RrF2 family transcriptional regulator [Sphaerisporangium aureirubrum]|uniref:RrF2 family transcriptional regulator n=1 Tax=Sphaerisporangium aureirubrum TaxID=1544736 RepID=A0ABW1NDN4_9ACTN